MTAVLKFLTTKFVWKLAVMPATLEYPEFV